MCNFFSLISDGLGHFHCFAPEQRVARVYDADGNEYNYDSHSSIADYYLKRRTTLEKPEDSWNRLEYDLYKDVLNFDTQVTSDDRDMVLAELRKLDFTPIAGDYIGAKKFIAGLKTMKWFDNHGAIPDGVKMFETRAAARNAARDAAWDAARDAAWDAAWGAAWGAAWDAARDAAWDAAWDAARGAARGAAWDAAWDAAWGAAWGAVGDAGLYCNIMYTCAGLPIAQEHINHIVKRWAVWEAGYGVICDVDGELYCYKKI